MAETKEQAGEVALPELPWSSPSVMYPDANDREAALGYRAGRGVSSFTLYHTVRRHMIEAREMVNVLRSQVTKLTAELKKALDAVTDQATERALAEVELERLKGEMAKANYGLEVIADGEGDASIIASQVLDDIRNPAPTPEVEKLTPSQAAPTLPRSAA